MNIGLIAHDSKKKLMQNLCIAYRGILSKHELFATGTTGRLIEEVTNLTVKKYTNPVVSVKIGNSTISGKHFNKEAYRVIPYSKFAKKKVKVTFNLKKGWHVIKQGVSYIEKSWYKSQDVDNGSIIPINSRDFVICADVVNEKTGQQERILLLLK